MVDYFINAVDTLNEWVGRAVSWLFLALTAAVVIDTLYRLFAGRGTDWAFDINYMIYGVQFMLASAFCLKHNVHVRVDPIYARFSPRGQGILEIVFYVLILFPSTIFLLDSCWEHFTSAVEAREISIVSAWHPPVYHFKVVMPLTFLLLLLQEIALFIRYIRNLKKRAAYMREHGEEAAK